MAISLTSNLPKHRGELVVHQQLLLQNDNNLYLWSSLDFIPGVNDIDLFIWHEEIGCFVVEIKAIPIDMLISYSFSTCEITGRGIDRSPQNQAYDAMQSLRNFVSPRMNKTPFMVATVCWSLISRAEWKEYFRKSLEISQLSDSMIMKDDLYSGSEILRRRLKIIWFSPPIRKGSDYPFKNDRDVFKNLCEILDPKATPQTVKTDIAKLEALEKGIKRDLMRTFPPYSNVKVFFQGRPGTGKTFRLQQIAIMHAREGAKVLLCCFNQVLASEFIRFINLLDLTFKNAGVESSIKEFIDIIDITSLALRICNDLGIQIEIKDFDQWGELLIEEFKKPAMLSGYPLYNTVLIDESQDFSNWQIELVLMLSGADATIAMGVGSGQELYSNKTMELAPLNLNGFKTLNLRRNFRNAKPIYELAYLVYECNFDSKRIGDKFSSAFINKKNSTHELEFDISEPKFPRLLYIDDDLDIQYDNPTYQGKLIDKLAFEYKNVILDQLKEHDQDPAEILILVPDTVGDEITALRMALKNIRDTYNVDYIDYVDKKTRRHIAPIGKMRVVTFHSSRGLESSRVIIFGIERLDFLNRVTKVDPSRLGYISISRAIFDLTICIRSQRKNYITDFIENSVSYINLNYG